LAILEIYRQIRGKNAGNAAAGDANSFLQRIIIEVITDNYVSALSLAHCKFWLGRWILVSWMTLRLCPTVLRF
jgi:hypothetical protein